jgi:hypothetical protein
VILRSVINHFRKQEWTAIFLDFLIVVLSVFIGEPAAQARKNLFQAWRRVKAKILRRVTDARAQLDAAPARLL